MKKILIVLWIITSAFAQYENYNANFGTTTSISCQIVNGAIFVNGRMKRRMNSHDISMLADYNAKVQKWKQGLIETIIQAVPFHIELGHPSGLQDWPFGPRNNPFESTSIRKRRAVGRFPDTPAFCSENN